MSSAPAADVRLALLPDRNTQGKADMTGAFLPESRRFADRVVQFPAHAVYPKRAATCLKAVREHRPATLAFFCHGLKNSLQAGFRKQAFPRNVEDLAWACQDAGVKQVVLYACSAGQRGGLAQELHRLTGIPVYGHTTAGHTTQNPHVILYDKERPMGQYLVEPGSADWPAWRQALRGRGRFLFPFYPPDYVLSHFV